MQYAVKGSQTVFPANLLAFLVGSRLIVDGTLVDSEFVPCHLNGNFRLKTEAVLFEERSYFLYSLAPEELVAGLHIAYVQIGEHIAEESKSAVHPGMPEIKHPPALLPQIAGPENHISLVFDNRIKQGKIIQRLVFCVSILHSDKIAVCFGKAGAERSAFSLIDLVMAKGYFIWIFLRYILSYSVAVISGTVIHYHKLKLNSALFKLKAPLNAGFQGLFLVVARYNERQASSLFCRLADFVFCNHLT